MNKEKIKEFLDTLDQYIDAKITYREQKKSRKGIFEISIYESRIEELKEKIERILKGNESIFN